MHRNVGKDEWRTVTFGKLVLVAMRYGKFRPIYHP